MINEELTQKEFNLAIRIGQTGANEIKKALDKLLATLETQVKNKAINFANGLDKDPPLKHGKQTLKQLQKHNAGLSTVELKNPNLRQLHREMKKSGIDFSAVKDGKGKYTLFFKSKDAATLTRALKGYTQKLVTQQNKPSIKKAITAAKDAVAKALTTGRDKVKNIVKGARSI